MSVIYEPKGMALEYAPLACNLYSGCTHGCTYCYAPACLRMQPKDFHARTSLRKTVLSELEKEAPKYVKQNKRVLFSFTSDAYQPEETGDTRTALKIMRNAGCPFQILTKGGTRATRDFDLYTKQDAFGSTVLFTDDNDRKTWEPNAANINDRIEAIKIAHSQCIYTWVSIEPVINAGQAIQLIKEYSGIVNEWKIGKLNHHPHAKTINWYDFAAMLYDTLQTVNSNYMIKDSLHSFLPKGAVTTRYAETISQVEPERQLALFI